MLCLLEMDTLRHSNYIIDPGLLCMPGPHAADLSWENMVLVFDATTSACTLGAVAFLHDIFTSLVV